MLKGAGIAPELQLSPEGVTTKGLDLGDVLLVRRGSQPPWCVTPLATDVMLLRDAMLVHGCHRLLVTR